MISLGRIVVSQSMRVSSDEMDEAIVNHIEKECELLISQQNRPRRSGSRSALRIACAKSSRPRFVAATC